MFGPQILGRFALATAAAAVFAAQLVQPLCAAGGGKDLDTRLRTLILLRGAGPLDPGPVHDAAKVELGQALFFDRELGGNRDTACASCHFPTLITGDGLSLAIGVKPKNPGVVGPGREKGDGLEFEPRHAPELFNRGSPVFNSQFWDSRVKQNPDNSFTTPAGGLLLPGLDSVLAAQAMFPVTSRLEMRGDVGDKDVFGNHNEMADVADANFHGIWSGLMTRLLAFPDYQALFAAAYPGKAQVDLTFVDAANAIAAFEADAFTFTDSPWDQYLAGDDGALSPQQKEGAILFFDKAGCFQCHAGSLFTDQKHWNIGVPQLGPGKGASVPLDMGRFLETGNPADKFRFRTPPLRNVAESGPWLHNGAFKDLRSVITHHTRAASSLLAYKPKKNLDNVELQGMVKNDVLTLAQVLATLDSQKLPPVLKNNEIVKIEAFLHSLTAPNLLERLEATVPDSVPSGLPVDGT